MLHSHQLCHFFISQLSTNHNNIQQISDIQMKPYQSTSPFICKLQLHLPILWSLIRAFYNTNTYSSLFLLINLNLNPKPCLLVIDAKCRIHNENFDQMRDTHDQIYKSMDTKSDQRSDKQYEILNYCFPNKMK